MPIEVILYGAMIAGGLVMLVSHQQFRSTGKVWARNVALAAGALVVVCAVAAIGWQMVKGPIQNRRRQQQQERVSQVRGLKLGEYLAATYGNDDGRQVIIVSVRDWGMAATDGGPLRAGLERGLAGRLSLGEPVVIGGDLEFDPEDPESMMAYGGGMDLFTLAVLDELAATQARNILVLLTELPMDYREAEIWTMEADEAPILVLMESMNLGDDFVQEAIVAGRIGAVVARNPAYAHTLDERRLPADDQELFDERAVLVTPANLQQLMRQHPALFGRLTAVPPGLE